LAAADLLENAACVVVTGGGTALAKAALAAPDPAIVVLQVADGTNLPPDHPAYGKRSETPAAFVCQGQTCAQPVTTPEALRGLFRRIAKN
ncbi:MAG TPA: thioredoxin domain-containing protein, partial [Acidocella sp.]|nr:thioredoxin domain-containing protein [Acidocella sp.]